MASAPCLSCPQRTTRSAASLLGVHTSIATPRRAEQEISNTHDSYETLPQYSEEQLKALYNDLFAPAQPQTLFDTPPDLPNETINALYERFNLEHGSEPAYRAVIDHIERALAFIAADQTHLPKLGLVLDSEWENLINAALDAEDMRSAITTLRLMKKCEVAFIDGLDVGLLSHNWLSSNLERFATVSDELTRMGYPLTAERLSSLITAHLRSLEQPSLESVKDVQNIIHKLEAQGTLPSQSGYTRVIKAYLDLSRESNLLSDAAASTNPSVAIAAVHDLFAHMRYVAYPIPSLETYSLVISACSRGLDVKPLRALELLKEVREGLMEGKPEFLQPKLDAHSLIACYNGAIRACARAGSKFAGDAFQLAKELVRRDGIPSAGAAISQLGPDRTTLTALIHSAKRTGDLGRTRWILTEAIRAQAHVLRKPGPPSESEAILDEEIMVCAFQAYSASRPPFQRGGLKEGNNEGEAPSETGSESIIHPIESSHVIPQSTPEILFEADTLFSRILSKRSGSPDLVFVHVPLSARILNAYLGIYLNHAPLQKALERHATVYGLPGMPDPNIHTFIGLLERLAIASKPERPLALAEAKKVWGNWLKWVAEAESGSLDPVLAEVTPRGIERAWAAIIKVHSLCDEIDAALSLLRDFIAKFPPTNLHQLPRPVPARTHLEHAPPANPARNIHDLLAAPVPRVGLLVRFTTAEQVTEPGIAPHLLFSDLKLLHHRLVARHSHRQADIAFVTWVCKAYEHRIRRQKENPGVVQHDSEPRWERGT